MTNNEALLRKIIEKRIMPKCPNDFPKGIEKRHLIDLNSTLLTLDAQGFDVPYLIEQWTKE